ncbi:hypothetical protein BDV06DRAFT_201682 [Aspergillus oleicola]
MLIADYAYLCPVTVTALTYFILSSVLLFNNTCSFLSLSSQRSRRQQEWIPIRSASWIAVSGEVPG